LCPVDCITDEYEVAADSETFAVNVPNQNSFKSTFNCDQSKPFITNKETPVMTFMSYFCYIGGIFGMWFGISANQLYNRLVERRLMFYFYLIEIYYWIRTKLMSLYKKVIATLVYFSNQDSQSNI